ncbi:type III PLP-dependent enzyme domain-containing protein [Amycolatopsis jiangsuensis]|uniref:Diaminopimelate decarboxylase n=1 Tax=Amycolatopsis jiangsuensis TaxID=1181879 RepID=A0A840J6I0_9PSEU|nr:type III PLP-dependent enzyme [Amycolatopsis jiangsuensis]MBB4689007.1 diaminopimelate decarboxylase [Amycolatopsis jiangsuensis]
MSNHDALAERFGTPAYVYDLDVAARSRDQLFGLLPENFALYYALKANPHPDLARELREGGCRAEISSTGELANALTAGFAPEHILYTGPGKTDGELDAAITAGVRLFSVESLTDLRHVGAVADRHGTVARCLLRVNTTQGSASTGIRMMGRPSQFGIDAETLPGSMPAFKAVAGTRVVGAHFFTMSNAQDEDSLLGEYEFVLQSAAQLRQEAGLPLELLDIGGGFSSPYAVVGQRTDYPKLRAGLEQLLDLYLPGWRTGEVELACESGRYLAGSCGTLLAGVVNVKESRGSRFVILDAGINVVGGLSGIGRLLPAAVGIEQAGHEPGHLVGPLCTPGDSLAKAAKLPELAPGDVVTVPNVGAYGVTASLISFLGRPAPTEVVVRGEEIVSVSRLDYQRAYEVSS